MNTYDKIFEKLEKDENVPMFFGGDAISYSEIKQFSEDPKKFLDYNSNLSLNKQSILEILSDSYKERMKKIEIQNENSLQKKLVPSKSYMDSNGFIDIALFFFTILVSALSMLIIMLFVIKSHL